MLGPGCECQPKVPPGAIRFSRMWTSVAPFVSMRACHPLETVLASRLSNVPAANVVLDTPVPGVARAVAAMTGTASYR